MTDHYALFGHPVAHSKSPAVHHAFAAQTGDDLRYELIDAPPGGFAQAVAAFRAGGGRGANVTMPFKLEALALATRPSARATLAGAANCLKFDGDAILADNMDGVGLLHDIQVNQATPLAGRRVLLMGAGGAARGAILPLIEAGPAALTIVNRTLSKAQALRDACADRFPVRAVGYGDLGDQAHDLVLNATSASMNGELPPAPDAVFAPGALAYDVVYGHGPSPFLAQARRAGAGRLADGLGMLIEQAAESYLWWRGTRPGTAPLFTLLRPAT